MSIKMHPENHLVEYFSFIEKVLSHPYPKELDEYVKQNKETIMETVKNIYENYPVEENFKPIYRGVLLKKRLKEKGPLRKMTLPHIDYIQYLNFSRDYNVASDFANVNSPLSFMLRERGFNHGYVATLREYKREDIIFTPEILKYFELDKYSEVFRTFIEQKEVILFPVGDLNVRPIKK